VVTVGVPKEIKDQERRVSLVPSSVADIVRSGATFFVQKSAGEGAGFTDEDYVAAGADIVPTAADAWGADLVVKVKEPRPEEYGFFRSGMKLFTYLHLAAEPELAKALMDTGVEAYAYETLTDRGHLPLLAPMSEIAGRASILHAGRLLGDGAGVLIGGAAGVPPAKVVVIGIGVSGTMAARGARGLDAEVIGIDVDLDRLWHANMEGLTSATLRSETQAVGEAVENADVVIGAALVPGARAPIVVLEEHVAAMRSGSVIVDLAIDQGGCVATAKPTSHSDPTYVEHGVIHYCVTNVPGQFPATSSRALSAAVAPRVPFVAAGDPDHPKLTGALNIAGGEVVHPAVAEALA
jgi:alanine dehydrogenase